MKIITAEVCKAETQIRRIERGWQQSEMANNRRWAEKRLAAISVQSPEVLDALVACKVLTEQDVKAALGEVTVEP